MEKEKKYMITVSCDPYNSRFHYHGEPVVDYDGRTPVEWIKEDELTEKEALEELEKISKPGCFTTPKSYKSSSATKLPSGTRAKDTTRTKFRCILSVSDILNTMF